MDLMQTIKGEFDLVNLDTGTSSQFEDVDVAFEEDDSTGANSDDDVAFKKL